MKATKQECGGSVEMRHYARAACKVLALLHLASKSKPTRERRSGGGSFALVHTSCKHNSRTAKGV